MGYVTIREAVETLSSEKTKHDLYVLTGECTAPKQCRTGADFHSVLKVTDPSLCDEEHSSIGWQDIQVFSPREAQLPKPRNFYDIIRLHRVLVQEFNGRAQLVASLGRYSSYCLYDGRPQGSLESYQTSSRHCPTAPGADEAIQRLLRNHAQVLRAGPTGGGPGANPYERTIQAIQPGTFFDLICKVLSVEVPSLPADAPLPEHVTHATLYVWDGTDARPFPCSTDTRQGNAHEQGHPPAHAPEMRQALDRLQRLPMLPYAPQEDQGSILPSLGTALPVVFFMLLREVALPSVGGWIRLRNVHSCVVAGQLQALYTAKSKWSGTLPNNDALDYDAARRRDNAVSSWADPTQLLGRCLHPEQPFSTLRQVLVAKGALVSAAEHGTAMHMKKFRCLVRVTAHQPRDVARFCLRREECLPPGSPGGAGGGWLYAVQLTLEDVTGEVDANLFDADGDVFFQGLPPQDLQGDGNVAAAQLRHVMHTLLGHCTDREGGEWLDCCMKLFHGSRGVCLRIFDTQLSDQTMALHPGNHVWPSS